MNDAGRDVRLGDRCRAWDAMHRYYFPDYDRRWARVIGLIHERSGGRSLRVLDLGCGPGTLTARLAAAIPDVTVIGVDADPLLVAMAEATSTRAGAEFECVLLGSAAAPGRLGRRAPFDTVVSSAFVHYFDRAGLIGLNRLCRGLLADDGILITAERFADDDQALAPTDDGVPDPWRVWWADTEADPAVRGLRLPGLRSSGAVWSEPPPLTLAAYLSTLDRTGFRYVVEDTGPSRIVVASPVGVRRLR